jgi:hypothetical protein
VAVFLGIPATEWDRIRSEIDALAVEDRSRGGQPLAPGATVPSVPVLSAAGIRY